VPSKAEVVEVSEEADLKLPLSVLVNPDPQKRSRDVQKSVASGTATLIVFLIEQLLIRFG